jgi:small subunit ribosomal protein S6
MNIECNTDTLEELSSAFRFNDAVLRNMIIHRKEAITDASPLVKKAEEKREHSDIGTDAGKAEAVDEAAPAATAETAEADSGEASQAESE